MSTLRTELRTEPTVLTVRANHSVLSVELSDGRTISVPLSWFPRLAHGTLQELKNWSLIGVGQGIHWEDLDEDISAMDLLAGRPSAESQQSFSRWMERRGKIPSSCAPLFPGAVRYYTTPLGLLSPQGSIEGQRNGDRPLIQVPSGSSTDNAPVGALAAFQAFTSPKRAGSMTTIAKKDVRKKRAWRRIPDPTAA